MTHQIKFGSRLISFAIYYKSRKTLNIQVHPDSTVYVNAPIGTELSKILKEVNKKAAWIIKQQDIFSSFLPRTTPRKYVNGETHLYLGRQYRLKKYYTSEGNVTTYRGYMYVYGKDAMDILNNWYKANARQVINDLFNEIVSKYPGLYDSTVTIHIKQMQARWGSCSLNGRITLNSELIKAPKACIEYVIIHELCHRVHPNHNKAFYRLLYRYMPDWEKWKMRLEKSMA